MKVRDRVCDICGESVYKYGEKQYKISKRYWLTDICWKKIDLCENCYRILERQILKEKLKEKLGVVRND